MGSTGYAEKTIIFRGASMKNLKKKVHFRIKLKSKHLLVIMSIFCVSCIAATFSSGVTTAPLQDAAGILIVPFENSINRISSVLKGMQDRMRDKEEILSENGKLTGTLTVKLNSNLTEEKKVSVMAAVYDSKGKLIGIQPKEIALKAGNENQVEFKEISADSADEYTIKILTWNGNISSLAPISNTLDLSIK